MLVILHKKLANWFLNTIWSKIVSRRGHSRLRKYEIDKDSKVREILIELRTLTRADRACLFQFHNGSVFTTKKNRN